MLGPSVSTARQGRIVAAPPHPLPANLERGVVSAMGAMAYGVVRREERPALLEVLGRVPV
jgi:hypothetical protein